MSIPPEIRFDGQVAIVTGAGGDLGRSYARLLASRGAAVVVNDFDNRDTDGDGLSRADVGAKEIREEGGKAIADSHSVSDQASQVIETAIGEWGRVDIVVNNAGIAGGAPFELADQADDVRMIDVHVHGAIRVTRAAWPHFAEQGRGTVVNIASSGLLGGSNSIYGAAKAAIIGLTRNLAIEGSAQGVRVNAVLPQAWTAMSAGSRDATTRRVLSEYFPPEKVAPFLGWLCHESCQLNGEIFSVGGGHVARVFIGVAEGIVHQTPEPEVYGGCVDQLMSIEPSSLPRDGFQELRHTARLMGKDLWDQPE
jgi:NAD(P)-dependent dehydrogenase (short-subunit alcohol dehydrogenase family)